MESYLVASSNVPIQIQSCNQAKYRNRLAQRQKIRDITSHVAKTSEWYLGVSADGHSGFPLIEAIVMRQIMPVMST